MRIEDVRAVVTGGASGLGAATVAHLRARGARAVVLDREVAGPGDLRCDETDADAVAAALDADVAAMGGLTAAICCAGIATTEKTLGRDGPHRLESWRRTLEVNLTGSFNVARLAAERMTSGGAIVLTASVAAFDGQKGQAAYAASKAGVAGLALPMARDLAREGIRVVAIAPGIFRTPMLEGLGQEVMDGLAADVVHPRRLGDPAEFAALAAFILECDYLNGTTIRLDGGLRMP